jgi:hypothetical protein
MSANHKERLIDVFGRIDEAYAKTGGKYKDENITSFLEKLRSGQFFELSEERQIGGLKWFENAYLGRGECLWGLIDSGMLPKGFDDEMRIAFMMHYLTMNSISENQKSRIRMQLAERIKE